MTEWHEQGPLNLLPLRNHLEVAVRTLRAEAARLVATADRLDRCIVSFNADSESWVDDDSGPMGH